MARERGHRSEQEPATAVTPDADAPDAEDDPPDPDSEREPGRHDAVKPERTTDYEPL